MTETNETVDLWGEIIASPMRTPLTVLKEQGALLERKTNGMLSFEIKSSSNGESFSHIFYLHSPILNFSHFLLGIHHPIEIYPIIMDFDLGEGRTNIRISDEAEFLGNLKNIFQSQKTQKVIQSLLAQSGVA